MNGMKRKKTRYLMVVLCVGMLALWGCPKKTEVSSIPETPKEETPVAVPETPREEKTVAQPVQKEEVKPVVEEVKERAAAAPAGLRPVYFDFNQALIEAESGEIMRANAEWLKAHPQAKVRIEGNCDERGTIEYNQTLGQRRAAIAKKYLTDMGISGDRILLISFGKEKSICNESGESCWQKNRRDDFTVVPQ